MRSRPGTRAGAVDVWILLILAIGVGIAALGVYAWNTRLVVNGLEESGIDSAIQDLQLVHKTSEKIREISRNASSVPDNQDAAMLLTFFEQQAREAGIDSTKIKGMQPLPTGQPRDGYREVSFKLQMQEITRDQLGKFLFRVEDQKPFIKSKNIDLKLDEFHNVTEVFVTLAYYVR